MEQYNTNQAPVSENRTEDGSMDLKALIYLCLANWKWFALSLIVCLGFACLYILRTPNVYTRNASIMMKDDKKSGNFTGEISEAFSSMGISSSSYNVINEMKALQSPTNVQEAVRRLDLNTSYRTKGTFHDNTLYGINNPVKVTFLDASDASASLTLTLQGDSSYVVSKMAMRDEEYDQEIEGACGDTLLTPLGRIVVNRSVSVADWDGEVIVGHTSVIRAARSCAGRLSVDLADKNATIVNLSYNDVSVQRADDFINTLIGVYNEKWIQDKNQIAVSTSMFINERLALIEEELGSVDKDISSYKSEHLIPDIKAASNMYMAQANTAALNEVELNNQVYMAKYIRNYLTESSELKLIPAISGIGGSTVSQQINNFNEKLLQRNTILANSSLNSPAIQDMDAALLAMRSAIVTSIDNELVTLQEQIKSQQRYGSKATSQMASNPDHAQHLLDVERQQKVKEAIYLFLLQKREENELSKAFTAYNTRVIAPPYGGDAPTSPRRSMILLVALVLGLAIPFAVLYLRNMLETSIKGRADLEGKCSIPFLGELPLCSKKSRRKMLKLFRKGKSPASYDVVKKGSRNQINEAFRILRTNFEFVSGKSSGQVSIVTSYNAGSGKSFVTNNLAISLAIKDKKVLIVDCDLRKGATSKFYGSPREGLSQYLGGYSDSIDQYLIQHPDHETMQILPVGTIPPNPTELVSHERFAALIAELRTRYDYIFLDCPPVEIVADTAIIERCADRTIFVVRSGLLERSMLPILENDYKMGKYKNLTLVLNGVELATRGYGYGRYGYGYSYGYGGDGDGYYSNK